ncbi:DUF2726 domain-containing protein [Vibrio tapetis subsp. quintayensis]|uniref:DUF2726 domain-containing protein n=1 Tax=Vibrio tapetis TaxID=52443 RepID=UPI0025B5BEAA|nr:DUF2726 domain-containing protein [Vibrio tapetis]MDN3679228.1 DUF2726 domain-containing protein [Vibrio tapetis subsp. quintayensis]
MESVAILLIVLVAFFMMYMRYFAKNYEPITYPYKKVGRLLSQSESAFYNALIAAVDNKAVVFSKVHMADVVTPPVGKNKKRWAAAFNRIARKHIDFVICRPGTLEVLCVIDFNDGSQLDKTKAEREKLLIHVCKTAGIPLIGANSKYSYQVGRLRKILAEYVDTISIEPEIRFCKECNSPMVMRVSNQGEFKGRRFYTCSRPACGYNEEYSEEVEWG